MGRHGENIRKRKDGRWEARVIDSYSLNGKAHYRYLYGKTYQEVKNKKKNLIAIIRVSSDVMSGQKDELKITFEQLVKEWLEFRKDSVKESTFANYTNLVEKHLLPVLGTVYLSSMTTELLDEFLRTKLNSGRLDGMGGLSPKTVADLRSVLLMSIEYARRRNYFCPVNNKVFYPKTIRSEARALTRSEQAKLEQFCFVSDGFIELGILVALYGGLRIGEICALQWGDINFAEGTVSVSKTIIRIRNLIPDSSKKTRIVIGHPKTTSSIRLVPLPSFILNHIKKHCGECEEYLLTGTRAFMEPRICLDKYKKILRRAGIQDYTFHALRHTFATRCVESDFDIKSLSEILGHANVSTTLQRYVHPSLELKKTQIERLENISVYGQNYGREK